jgi:hypothetical protein
MSLPPVPEPSVEQPPVGQSWPLAYGLVAGALLVEIVFFYALMRYFS